MTSRDSPSAAASGGCGEGGASPWIGKAGGDSQSPELRSSQLERGFCVRVTPAEQKNYNLKKQTNKQEPQTRPNQKQLLFCFKASNGNLLPSQERKILFSFGIALRCCRFLYLTFISLDGESKSLM